VRIEILKCLSGPKSWYMLLRLGGRPSRGVTDSGCRPSGTLETQEVANILIPSLCLPAGTQLDCVPAAPLKITQQFHETCESDN
jgi:hypothetical protein